MTVRFLVGALCLACSAPALAEENYLEGWFEGTLAKDLGDDSFVQFQTQQRARGSDNPTGDNQTYRLWLGHKFGDLTASAGIHRSKEGSTKETRLLQQVSYPLGGKVLKGRTRLEQRFVDNAAQTGWRLRQRVGVTVPVSAGEDPWKFAANTEAFWTLRATSRGGQDGLTGLRSFIGFEKSLGQVDLGIGYTRQQNIRRNAPDRIGHAPTLNLTLNL